MKIINEDNVEFEYSKFLCLKYLQDRCNNIKHSLRLVEKNKGHLKVRCPLSGEYLVVNGTIEEINWLHEQLTYRQFYRIT